MRWTRRRRKANERPPGRAAVSQPLVDRAIADVVRKLDGRDDELAAYAEAARRGDVP